MELTYRIKDHLSFTTKEKRNLLIAILAVTFIVAYNDRSETFQLAHWLLNFVIVFALVFVSFLIQQLGHKITSLKIGLKTEYKMWPTGLIIGVIISFISGGKYWIILPGSVFVEHMAILRLGHFRYGLNTFSYGMIALAGPIANLLLATFFKTIALIGIAPDFFGFAAFFNLYYAVFQMLPLPNNNGIHMFFAARLVYVFVFGMLIGYILLYLMGFYSLIFAVIIGGLFFILYYITIERQIE